MRRKFAIFFFIVIVNIPFAGFNLFYQIRKLQIETSLRSAIAKAESEQKSDVCFNFSRDNTLVNLTWVSKREFIYQGKVYHVNKVKYIGDNIIYTCSISHDTKELLDNLAEISKTAASKSADTQKASDNLTNFFNSLFNDEVHIEITKPNFLIASCFFNPVFNEIKTYYKVVVPPPKA